MDGRTCNICNKIYASYKSLWNHNNKFHINDVKNKFKLSQESAESKHKVSQESAESKHKVSQESYDNNLCKNIDMSEQYIFNCKLCNKIYKHKQSKYRHERLCKNIELKDDNKIIAELKKENLEIKNTLNELLKQCKIHPKTLQKINKQLINGNVNNGTINNKTVNIVKFGTEDLNKILSQSEILKILNRKMCSLEESIKIIHFNNDRPEFKNIYITNLKDQYAYTYDGSKFIAVLKSDILEELIDNHIENIEYSAEEYKEKLNQKTIEVLDKFIDKINNEEDIFIDKQHEKSYPNFKSYNINKIKLMIYNLSDKKTNIVNVICSKNKIPILE